MTVEHYLELRERLEAPPGATIGDWPEFVLPHRPPPDPLWPSPDLRHFDPDRQGTLLFRLPLRQCVICAATAVEMVLACWNTWPGLDQQPAEVRDAPAFALRTVYRWLRERVDKAEMQHALQLVGRARQRTERARHAEQSGLSRVASYVARAMETLLDTAFVSHIAETYESEARRVEVQRKADATVYLVISVHVQAYLSGLAGVLPALAGRLDGLDLRRNGSSEQMRDETWAPIANAVWAHWWSRCRCRLAFCDATTARLS